MPRISRSQLHEERLKEITQHFYYLITSLTEAKEIENFFTEFLTKEEKIMLSKRLVLFMLLKKNYSPPIIQSILHISYETVRTYQNQLSAKNDRFNKTVEKLVQKEKTEALFRKMEAVLKPLDLALQAKNNMKARQKLIIGDWK